MSIQQLGRLEAVDIRHVWNGEASDFTPWLAREGNLGLLGEALNVDLELHGQEKNVGPFRADLLCKDTSSGAWVLVENQLERTDHSHLGQLITYAAGLEAVTIIWIARRFTEEHRAALDWLNEITGDKFNFFGIELELWRIGNSAVAPKFNLVAKPNEWTKAVLSGGGRVAEGELSQTKQKQRDLWGKLMDSLEQTNSVIRACKPQPQHWMNLAIGRSRFSLVPSVNTAGRFLRVSLIIYGGDRLGWFDELYASRAEIEEELGQRLIWDRMEGKKESHIEVMHKDVDPLDESRWPEYVDWFRITLERFHKLFATRVKNLPAIPPAVSDQPRQPQEASAAH